MKQFASSVGAIEHVINYFAWRDACSSGIGQRYLDRPDRVKKGLRPLFLALNLQKRSRFVDGAAAGVIARATRADEMGWRDELRFLLGILLTGSKKRWEL